MKKYLKYDHYYKDDAVRDNWNNIRTSLNHLYNFYDKNIVKDKFMIIGPVDIIKSIAPESAIKIVYDVPGTDLIVWEYRDQNMGYKVTFIATDRVSETIVTFLQEQEVDNNESESKSTE